VTIIPEGTGGQGVTITGTNYAAFGQDVYTGIPFAAPRKYSRPPHLNHAAEHIPRFFESVHHAEPEPHADRRLSSLTAVAVGDLRFTAPQAPTWNTTSFSATKPPPACLQNPNGTLAGSYGISEDCLYLNVYTPAGANASTAYLPVMVWVYGGGFTSGSSSYYNATFLMLEGISTVCLARLARPLRPGQMQWLKVQGRPFIFVSLNYRLGIFGWGWVARHRVQINGTARRWSDSSSWCRSGAEIAQNNAANLGLRDVTKGLQWVQENIWAFGGNPSEASGVIRCQSRIGLAR
jgi:hypothetical protein